MPFRYLSANLGITVLTHASGEHFGRLLLLIPRPDPPQERYEADAEGHNDWADSVEEQGWPYPTQTVIKACASLRILLIIFDMVRL